MRPNKYQTTRQAITKRHKQFSTKCISCYLNPNQIPSKHSRDKIAFTLFLSITSMWVRLEICRLIGNPKNNLVFISYFENFALFRYYHRNKNVAFHLDYVIAKYLSNLFEFKQIPTQTKYEWEEQQIPVLSGSQNPNLKTNFPIVKITNPNIAICLCLGSKTPPKLWYPNIFVPKFAPPWLLSMYVI